MTKYSQKTREEVFLRYGAGEPILAIAKQVGINPKTIYRWRDQYEWDTRKEKIDEEMSNYLVQSVAKIKARQIMALNLAIDKFVERMLGGKIEIKVSDALVAMRYQLELLNGPDNPERGLRAEDFANIYDEIKEEEKRELEEAKETDKKINRLLEEIKNDET
jgi:transposase-like protein